MSSAFSLIYDGFLLGLLFNSEDGSDNILPICLLTFAGLHRVITKKKTEIVSFPQALINRIKRMHSSVTTDLFIGLPSEN
jgi:hypothetical protein